MQQTILAIALSTALCALLTSAASYKEMSLDGQDWSVVNSNGSIVLHESCTVPGDIYGDLMKHHVIGDPFWRFNDDWYKWIAYENWTYSKTIRITSSIKAAKRINLIFDGVQVISRVFLENIEVGQTENQFRQYNFDVTNVVKRSNQTSLAVKLVFTSSVLWAAMKFNTYSLKPRPVAPPFLWSLPNRNFIRAEQSSFGWDWGPSFAPMGIYRSVKLRAYSSSAAHMQYIVPHIFPLPFNKTVPRPLDDHHNAFWIQFYVYYDTVDITSDMTLTLSAPTLNNFVNSTTIKLQDENYAIVEAYLANVKLWWPNGYGSQVLHDVFAELADTSGHVLDSATIKVGVRSIELITRGDPLQWESNSTQNSEDGDLNVMFFRVNGVPLFIKGSNLIPFDAFQSRVNQSVMVNILDSATDANMNMVRVWGGGIFPLDSFYEYCDEKGILVWQEMIFACAPYPIDEPFLDNAKAEIRHQLRRLGKHSSIAIWSGNNENGIYDGGPGSPYEILDYDNVLMAIIREDTSRPIWPSSPSTGFSSGVTPSGLPAGTQSHPLPFKVGGKSGDTHYYNYFSCPNVALYPKTNFGSEYGFQSLPLFSNIAPVSLPKDWSLFSDFMNHRQHHPFGNAEMAALLTQNFQVPDFNSTDVNTFKRIIYLSQVQQVLCIADEASYYRRGRDMPYRTMGSLYWQLNQNWQAPSWTSIEYRGQWKILHYAMKDVYQVTHLSGFLNFTDGTVTAHIASDSLTPIAGVTITIEIVPFVKGNASTVKTLEIDVPALRGVFFWKASLATLQKEFANLCPSFGRDCFLYLTAAQKMAKICPSQPIWLTKVKEFLLNNNTEVAVSLDVVSPRSARIALWAIGGVAPYSFIQTDVYYGSFSRNGFALIPHRQEMVSFELRDSPFGGYPTIIDPATLLDSLRIDTLTQGWH